MRPGVTSAPDASITSSPSGDKPSPTSTMIPSRTRTSPGVRGAPVPSTIVPPCTSTSPTARLPLMIGSGGHHRAADCLVLRPGLRLSWIGKTGAVPTEETGRGARLLVARYELGDRLGYGGMGEVWAATDRRLGRDVAVKQLRMDLAEQPVARRRFEIEARAAAGLTHPNIVTVYDCGEDNGRPFLVMERLPGRTLADEIALGPVDPERAVEISCAVLSALSAAHDAGIIHRDIKPGNVLLTDTGVPKVSDFGIAKTADTSTATVTGELLATPAYLAPERLRGQPASRVSDLYAVGVLLYESLSGTRPFQGDTPIAVLDAVARGDATPLSSICPGLPDAVVAVVERSMAIDPASRFA